ncbi:Nitrous oxide reductase maturation protein, outer-membrane lipoprotein NosL [hydrothermal vent metagenome]|uniref:Nitrous oxide reductase maturation protein, outer-membrane lipoprotein NosL n=1 Tax=hydrothermal vent metagenome TaxID=652676 RepID=A0A3B0VSS1_9ZZZZ
MKQISCLSVNRVTNLGIMTVLALAFILAAVSPSPAAPEPGVNKDTRCAVCGMFVARYPNWIAKIVLKNGKTEYFDGPKDMLAYYFSPAKYGGTSPSDFKAVMVQDYYTLKWLDARKAFFVVGSDVHGPMGKEFIPFASEGAAKSFAGDHKAHMIMKFDQITMAQDEAMRGSQMMKMK